MKGLTHFMSGIAAATFVPEVVRMSTSSRIDSVEGAIGSFIILLAGAFGVLPDTMDFKMGHFFSIAEYEVDPHPIDPDPQEMCDIFAKAVEESARTKKMVRIEFFPTQLGSNKWRQYIIKFEPDEVIIQFNGEVSTSQLPIPGSTPPPRRLGRAKLAYELKSRTENIDWLNQIVRWMRQKLKGPDKPPGPVKPSTLDILSGTQFGFEYESDGKVYFNWLPWHRTWSHSYVLMAMLAVPVGIITYLLHIDKWWLYPCIAFLGGFVHITEDMTGHIGGSLLWPLWKTRSEGLELFKASDPRTNFSICYTAIILTIYNLDRFSTKVMPIPGWLYFLLFWVVPMVFYFWLIDYIKKQLHKQTIETVDEEPDGMGDAIVD